MEHCPEDPACHHHWVYLNATVSVVRPSSTVMSTPSPTALHISTVSQTISALLRGHELCNKQNSENSQTQVVEKVLLFSKAGSQSSSQAGLKLSICGAQFANVHSRVQH